MPVIEKCAPATSVLIAVPSYDWTIHTATAQSLIAGAGMLGQLGCQVSVLFGAGNCYVDQTRNALVEHFLQDAAYSDMVFVDSDVMFEAKVLARLCLSTKPLCAALYPKKLPGEVGWPVDFTNGDPRPERLDALPTEQTLDDEGMLQALYLPTGCLRINRQVFVDMERHRRVDRYMEPNGAMARRWFRLEVDSEIHKYWGEDFLFCRDWREIGGKAHFLPDATLGHVGKYMWVNNWMKWRTSQGQVKQTAGAADAAG